MKKKLLLAICAVVVILSGCSMYNVVGELPIEEYIADAKAIAKGEEKRSELMLLHHAVNEDGIGIALYETGNGLGGGDSSYALVLRTTDGGENWEVNPEEFIFSGSCSDLEIYQNYVIMTTFGSKTEIGTLCISNDYGKTFKQISFADLVFVKNGSSHDTVWGIRGDILGIDKEKKNVQIGWYKYDRQGNRAWDTKDGDKDVFLTGNYDFENMCMVSIQENNPRETAEIYIENIFGTGNIFAESNEKYLTVKDVVQVLKELPEDVQSKEVLRLAINEIYARKGYDFSATAYENYFSRTDWYQEIEKRDITEEMLNTYEKSNIDLLISIE